MATMRKIQRWIIGVLRPLQMFARRMLCAPFAHLPPAFGNTITPELRVLEAEMDEIEHGAVGTVTLPEGHGHTRSRAARRNSFLERDQ